MVYQSIVKISTHQKSYVIALFSSINVCVPNDITRQYGKILNTIQKMKRMKFKRIPWKESDYSCLKITFSQSLFILLYAKDNELLLSYYEGTRTQL